MTYEYELINPDELKVGKIFKIKLLEHFARDHRCALINIESNNYEHIFNAEVDFEVKHIIKDCSLFATNLTKSWNNLNYIVIIERKK